MNGAATIEGYASVFGERDEAGDRVVFGAFRRSLAARGARGIAMLWQHDPGAPIGRWDVLAEDRWGLHVRGRLLTGLARGREAAVLIAAGALTGLSIGFRPRRAVRAAGTGERILQDIDLWEISLVTFPQADKARIRRIG
ncbi:hypothetical protein GCM10011316_23770 [Roseibium aquae]|uniref:Prohead serine protease domain-containing protein n=1 Tax=Roseibium aquae TaxID=1323746 RepID=A0A916TL36_9HYPH|nr:HK97 family phage prohead protease [Roseibium aquae]GGB50949.1 hypothetical protein GCM10011316_23770 [Roseibium aquae]